LLKSLARSSTVLATAVCAALIGTAALAQSGVTPPDVSSLQSINTTPTQEAAPAPALGAVAAVVNDDIISDYDLRQRMMFYLMTTGVRPTQENLPQIQQQALSSLVDERLELQELRKMEKTQKFTIIADDSEVDGQLGQIAKENNLTLATLKAQMARAGVDISTLREQIRAQTSWQRMIRGRYGSRIRIGQSQIDMQLQRLKASAGKPQYQLAEIYLDPQRAGGMNEALTGANQLVAQIQQGAPFPAVARQFSSAPSAASGGDMGWVSQGELSPELAAAVEQMTPNTLSQPIQATDGVYILFLRAKRAGSASTLVSLKQAAVELGADAPADKIAAAGQTLTALQAQGLTCDNLEASAAKASGVVASDLGEADVNDLSGGFRTAAESLPIGQLSAPIRTATGVHALMVCGRRTSDAQLPSAKEIESKLLGEQLTMVSRRYLRDLRNTATIETP
jgi:peptidyl-prolyl cis-trans isomerase SurA